MRVPVRRAPAVRESPRTMLVALTTVALLCGVAVPPALSSSGRIIFSSGEILADVSSAKVGPEPLLAQPPSTYATLPTTWTGSGAAGGSNVSGGRSSGLRPVGVVDRVYVSPGQLVEAGVPVLRLDRRMAFNRVRQARVMESLGSARIALLDEQADKLDEAGVPLASARSQLSEVGGMISRARATVEAEFASGTRKLTGLIASMTGQLATARQAERAAGAAVATAQAAYDADPTPENLAKLQQAQAQLAGARTGVAKLGALLRMLAARQRSLGALKAEALGTIAAKAALIPTGLAKLAQGEAKLAEANVKIRAARKIAVARRRQAAIQGDVARLVLSRLVIRAPRRGYVTALDADVGEVAFTNAAVAMVSVLDPVKLGLQLSPSRARLVRVGDAVSVTVDAWPGRVFRGEVTHVADRVDLMPTNVVTEEIHASRAVQVTVSIANPDLLLKPGVPADAEIRVSP